MRVHLGCDHAGVELKGHLLRWLAEHGYGPVDHGPFLYDPEDDYPVFCLRAAEGVRNDRERGLDSLGVVIGGSGNGEQIAANKVRGIRSALGWNEDTAALARRHNDAQVLAVGGPMHTRDQMTRLVEVFPSTPFPGEDRHRRRIEMLARYETTGERPPLRTPRRESEGPIPGRSHRSSPTDPGDGRGQP